jgi:hypothetical protein
MLRVLNDKISPERSTAETLSSSNIKNGDLRLRVSPGLKSGFERLGEALARRPNQGRFIPGQHRSLEILCILPRKPEQATM